MPRCRRCRSTGLRILKKIEERDIHGILEGGRRYTKVIWRDAECESCGMRQRLVYHEYDPTEWEGGANEG